ncbi:MAG: hypothetical protein JKY65_26770, partial [Planctomycetes bacterium]|nr:hypothetical protein [Planctomycetota bacterium]
RLVETGARPRDRGGTERLCEAIWAAGFRRAITLKQAEQGYVSLVELDVDLDGVHYSYEGLIPRASTSSPPASQYLHLRVGLRLRASADTDRAYEHLRRLGRDKRLGPTTRARALSLGLRSAPLTQRLAMIEEALALDPKSAHVRLAHAHTLLVAGRAGPGLAKLSPAWKEWRALYGDRRASEIEESVLLNRSLRMLLKNGLVEEARSLLRRSVTCRDHLPIGHAPRTGLLSRFDPQRGFSSAWDQAWLETGAPGQR